MSTTLPGTVNTNWNWPTPFLHWSATDMLPLIPLTPFMMLVMICTSCLSDHACFPVSTTRLGNFHWNGSIEQSFHCYLFESIWKSVCLFPFVRLTQAMGITLGMPIEQFLIPGKRWSFGVLGLDRGAVRNCIVNRSRLVKWRRKCRGSLTHKLTWIPERLKINPANTRPSVTQLACSEPKDRFLKITLFFQNLIKRMGRKHLFYTHVAIRHMLTNFTKTIKIKNKAIETHL